MKEIVASAGSPEQLDRALIALRRFWTAPTVVPDGVAPVELSTLLVLEAVLEGPVHPDGEIWVGLVAERLDVRPSTASRLVDRAVAAGVLVRRLSSINGRRTSLVLTAPGRSLANRAREFRAARLGALLEGWSAHDRQQLGLLLERLTSAVRTERPRT
jgi:DNA-binding MarR family transcriptional regulator